MSSAETFTSPTVERARALPAAEVIDRPPWRGRAAEPFDSGDLQKFLADPLALFALPGVKPLDDWLRRPTRVSLEVGGTRFAWIVEEFRNQGLIALLRKGRGKSPAMRGWLNGRTFLARGIPTAMPRLALERRGPLRLVQTSVLVVDEPKDTVRLPRILGHLESPDPALPGIEKQPFLEALARFLRDMHNQGVLHGDLSIGRRLLVQIAGLKKWTFSVVQVCDAKIAPALRAKERLVDLVQIPIHPDDRRDFFAAYCQDSERLLALEEEYLSLTGLLFRAASQS
jgi:hypothetical protein